MNAVQTEIAEQLLMALLKAQHNKRLLGLREPTALAVRNGLEEWAYLCGGFQSLLLERHEGVDAAFLEALRRVAKLAGRPAPSERLLLLGRLLLAHASRRHADALVDSLSTSSDLNQRALAEEAIAKSREHYRALTAETTSEPRPAMLAWHGLGVLLVIEGQLRNPDGGEGLWWGEFADRASTAFQQALELGTRFGVEYAPPMNRLATLAWKRSRCITKDSGADEAGLLDECLGWAERAIRATDSEYAPPLLLKARALFRRTVLTGDDPPVDAVTDLLKVAVTVAPFDPPVHRDILGFAEVLPQVIQGAALDSARRRIRILLSVNATDAALRAFFRAPGKGGELHQDRLVVLRRWSSFSPLLSGPHHSTVGGGYLLEWAGKRIAIDPGVGFLANLHHLGLSTWDLDAVVVTHQHIDHCADFEALLGCLKEFKKVSAKLGTLPTKEVAFFLSQSGFERWEKARLPDSSQLVEHFEVVRAGQEHQVVPGVRLVSTPLLGHPDMLDEAAGRAPTGFGIVLELQGGCRIGITSDSGYWAEDNPALSQYFRSCDVLVAHLSTVSDLDPNLPATDSVEAGANLEQWGGPSRLYRKHLGFWGTFALLRDLASEGRSDRTILLSEFGEEMLASRFTVIDELRSLLAATGPAGTAQAARVHLSDTGTVVRLPQGGIACQFAGGLCASDATFSEEVWQDPGDPTFPHRGWADRAVRHLCERHHSIQQDESAARFAGVL
ncbi:MAG: MBL fold metallo-hydrolase [Thermoanaerobaculaceae bacterium]